MLCRLRSSAHHWGFSVMESHEGSYASVEKQPVALGKGSP